MKPSHKRQNVKFSSVPVLGVHLPMWRSKLVVFLLFMAFVALAARAFWIQPGNAFYRKQGESRYQRTIDLPATRGKILDRNGPCSRRACPCARSGRFPTRCRTISMPTRSTSSASSSA